MKRLIIAMALLSAGCTESDLSTPEGRARDASIRAIGANAWNDVWNHKPPPPTPMMICTPAGYVMVCQ